MYKSIITIVLLGISSTIFSLGINESVVDAKEKVVVGLVLDSNGLGDQDSNDNCYLGLERASEEGIITLRVKKTDELLDYKNQIDNFVSEGVNLIYLIGEENKKTIIDAANKYKKTIFIGVDMVLTKSEIKPNLYGINFKEQEGGYLAGLVAGSMTYKYSKRHSNFNAKNRVGIILGNKSSPNRRFEVGYYAGVKAVNPSCDIVSININSLNDPKKGADAVLKLKEKGVDIVFSVAGNSDYGVFDQALKSNLFVIGANRDLANSSDSVFTSVVKKLYISTYLLTKDIVEKEIETGTNVSFGLNNGAIDLAPYYKYDRYIAKDLRDLISDNMKKLSNKPDFIPETIGEIVYDSQAVPEFEEEY